MDKSEMNSTLRVLQILPTLSAGGAESFITSLCISLSEVGVDVRVFLMAGLRGERGRVLLSRLEDAGVQVIGKDGYNIRSPLNVLRIAWLVWRWRPAIVQANLLSAEIICGLARVFTLGGGACFMHRVANTKNPVYAKGKVAFWFERYFRLSIACSQAVATAYYDLFRDGHKANSNTEKVQSKRVRRWLVTIDNGVAVRQNMTSCLERHTARQQLGLPETGYVVSHIGRFAAGVSGSGGLSAGQKAHDVLIKAFAAAFPKGTENLDCVLVLVGDGPLRQSAEALAAKLEVRERTYFLGEQPDPWATLTASDVFCFPSRHEGLPNTLIEAASCGLPIVASDIPEIRNIIGKSAWHLCPVDDDTAFAKAMIAAKQDGYNEHTRRQQAMDMRERFSMKTCAEQYIQAYRFAIGQTKRNESVTNGRALDIQPL